MNEVKKPWLVPFRFKIGHKSNGGRPKGKSMKEYTRDYLQKMSEVERIAFLNGIDKETAWRMAEGNPPQQVDGDIKGTLIVQIDQSIADKNNVTS